MTAISDLVAYEREYPLALRHPKTRERLGITFWVKHIDCDAASRVARISVADVLGDKDEKDVKEYEQIAACISRWDWAGNEFEEGKGELEYSPENASYVLHHSGGKWITAQVRNAVTDIGNFIND